MPPRAAYIAVMRLENILDFPLLPRKQKQVQYQRGLQTCSTLHNCRQTCAVVSDGSLHDELFQSFGIASALVSLQKVMVPYT